MNRVGLTAVVTSRAVIVDASSPAACYVYDVISDTQTIDIDYTVRVFLTAYTIIIFYNYNLDTVINQYGGNAFAMFY